MEEPGGLQSMGSQRVGHNFTLTFSFSSDFLDEILIGVDKIWMVGEGDCFRCVIKGMIWVKHLRPKNGIVWARKKK